MKNEIIIVVISIFLVLLASFFIFNQQNTTGFAIFEENVSIVTEEDALNSISESNNIIKEMQENKFSILYMEDTLLEANRVFEQAKYAEILRGNKNASEEEKANARITLNLIDWKKIDYSNVLIYTDKIKARKIQAFILYDSITAINESIQKYRKENIQIDDAVKLLNDVNIAFYEDRYEDCENFLIELRTLIENKKSQTTILASLGQDGKNFIQRNWILILVLLIFIPSISFFSYKQIRKKLLKKKIKKLKVQQNVLIDLVKKTQIERFKENKIPDLVYNIRMKKYQDKLVEIREELPVLESKLLGKKGK
jgi:hypothetical protein